MKYLILALTLISFSSVSHATCWLDGNEYPTGTEKGPMTCDEDGYWKPTKDINK